MISVNVTNTSQQGMPKPGWMETPDSPGSDQKFKV